MTYKTILVYVDEAERCAPVLKAAKLLATREKAHLIGLHVIPDIEIYSAAEAQLPAEVFDIQRRFNAEIAQKAEAEFNSAISGSDLSFEWRMVEERGVTIGDRVMEHALVADAVIAGQIDPDVSSTRRVGTPEKLLLSGRRPMLLVPYIGFQTMGTKVGVAWNGSAEASRAVFDALPILRKAKSVALIAIDQEEPANAPASAESMAKSLERHGIAAEVNHSVSAGVDIGSVLLSRLADDSIDLLVMGGYGHSRLREFVFGGATRSILQQMTVPVLMSH